MLLINIEGENMKFLVSLLIIVSFVNGKDNKEEQYLDDSKAHILIQNGKKVLCQDDNGEKYYLHKSQFVFLAGGLYFYNVNNEPIMTNQCILEK